MALDDIVIASGNGQAIEEVPTGLLFSPVDILTESNSNSGANEAELILTTETSSIFII
jgi:hypothetical protein